MYTSFCLFSGLKLLSTITNQRKYDLRIDFSGLNGTSWHIKFCNFKVGSEFNNYKMTLGSSQRSRNTPKMGVSFLALSKITFFDAIFWILRLRRNIYFIATRSQIIFLYFLYDKWSEISDKIIRVIYTSDLFLDIWVRYFFFIKGQLLRIKWITSKV